MLVSSSLCVQELIYETMNVHHLLGKKLRVIARCLINRSYWLDVSAVARFPWYSTQIGGAPSPKFRVSSQIIVVGVDFQSLNLCLMTLCGVPNNRISFSAGGDGKDKCKARKDDCV